MNYRRHILPWLVLAFLSAVPQNGAHAQTLRAEALHGLEFREIGPVTMSGRIVDIAVVESNPFTFYTASATV